MQFLIDLLQDVRRCQDALPVYFQLKWGDVTSESVEKNGIVWIQRLMRQKLVLNFEKWNEIFHLAGEWNERNLRGEDKF